MSLSLFSLFCFYPLHFGKYFSCVYESTDVKWKERRDDIEIIQCDDVLMKISMKKLPIEPDQKSKSDYGHTTH